MFDKFNFYDLLGYLLPGAAVVLTVYWVGKLAFEVPFPAFQGDLATSFVFLGGSYVAGHLVQSLGSIYERRLKRKWHGHLLRLSELLLLCPPEEFLPSPERFSEDLIGQIYLAANKVFKTERNKEQEAEIFELAYALMVQKGFAQHTEIFQAIYGLARGMLVATAIGLLVALGVTFLSANRTAVALSLAAQPVLVGIGWLLWYVFDRFRYYFAKSVYWNFLAWYSTK